MSIPETEFCRRGAAARPIESNPPRTTFRTGGAKSQGSSRVGIGGELRAGSAGIEGILPSFEGGTPSIPGYSRRARGQHGETRTPAGDS